MRAISEWKKKNIERDAARVSTDKTIVFVINANENICPITFRAVHEILVRNIIKRDDCDCTSRGIRALGSGAIAPSFVYTYTVEIVYNDVQGTGKNGS